MYVLIFPDVFYSQYINEAIASLVLHLLGCR
jgi:hypothetical protein